MDVARAVQHWPDADFMTHNYSPEEILGLLRQLGERAEWAERERDEVKEESKVLRRQRESYKKERNELREALRLISSGTTTDILGLTSMSKEDMQSIARRALEGSNAT